MKSHKQITVSQYRLDRRGFLAAACLTLIGRVSLASDERPDSTRWAMLADTHIPTVDNSANPPRNHHYFNPLGNAEKIMTAVAADPTAGMIIAGDLARLEGKIGDYENLAERIALLPEKYPVFMALGNHDHRENFRHVFKKTPGRLVSVEDRHVTIIDAPPIRFIVLDSLKKVNLTEGELSEVQTTWLKDFLADGDHIPTIIVLHHTLSPLGGGFTDVAQFYDVIRPARSVKAVLFGHSHVPGYAAFDDIHLINLPAAGYSFKENVPIGWMNATLTPTAGRFKLNTIGGPAPAEPTTELTWRQ
ncbi:MAG: metallophosphoesterase [Phycisphaerae bacterium]|nr:metallophosphoesterase [Phycisphaerae bacterium]